MRVDLTSAYGVSWHLTGGDYGESVRSPESSLSTLVGVSQRSDVPVPGRSGVVRGRQRFGPIQGTVDFYLRADDGEGLERVHREFRRGWSTAVPSVLSVSDAGGRGTAYLDLFLDGSVPGVAVDPSRRTAALLTVPVIAPAGLWRIPMSGRGTVSITNMGDEAIYPVFYCGDAGGVVTTPSGARFTLPPGGGVVDADPRRLKLPGVFPEGVERGNTRTWVVPDGVTVSWNVLVADPWA